MKFFKNINLRMVTGLFVNYSIIMDIYVIKKCTGHQARNDTQKLTHKHSILAVDCIMTLLQSVTLSHIIMIIL